MKIQWRNVTWYSKLLALALFVALPFIGFYFGLEIGEGIQFVKDVSVSNLVPQPQTGGAEYYKNVSEWQVFRQGSAFVFSHPIDFQIDESFDSVQDWRLNANGALGIKYVTLTIPGVFEPQTNFSEAKLTIGESRDSAAVKECLTPDPGEGQTESPFKINLNGAEFSVFKATGAGTGNYYDTTSYRALHAGRCFAVEYTIHSTQVANYPESYHLHQFDKGRITDLLDRIVGTFKLL